jgi:hypothetical protein
MSNTPVTPWDHLSNWVILGTLKDYALMELYSAAMRDLPQDKHLRTLFGAFHNPLVDLPDGRPTTANFVEHFDTQQVNGWLQISRAEPVTSAFVLLRPDLGRNTSQPSRKNFFNPVDFYDDVTMSDPAEESNLNIHPKNSHNYVIPKNSPGLEKCMTLVCKQISCQQVLLH